MTGFRAVTRIGLRCSASATLSFRTFRPAIAWSASARIALASRPAISSRSQAISGSITLSWKLPLWPATDTAWCRPITCAQTMHAASGTTGLTLPGMIEEPGCSAGSSTSASPASGPEFIQRRSLPIFISATASALYWPDSSTRSSCAEMPSKVFSACPNFTPVAAASALATPLPNLGWALMPVPIAVPPIGRRRTRLRLSSIRACADSSCADHVPNSCAKVSGIASIRCVRPVLTVLPSALPRLSMALRRCASAGNSVVRAATTAITRRLVGTTSLLLWPRLTWSFGWMASPAAALATCAITSLAFMLLEVPEPVW